MKKIKGLIFDIGGVLYVGSHIVPGTADTIAQLQKRYPMRFVTNTTRRIPASIIEKLSNFGFKIGPEELFTALDATKSYVLSRQATVETVLTDEADRYFEALKSENPDFVVVGDAHTNFDFAHMNKHSGHLRAVQNSSPRQRAGISKMKTACSPWMPEVSSPHWSSLRKKRHRL